MAQLGKMFSATRAKSLTLEVVALNVAGQLLEEAKAADRLGLGVLAVSLRAYAAELTIAVKNNAPASGGAS